jgi:hypothetical protein
MMNRSSVVAFSLVALSLIACTASSESSEGTGETEAAVTIGTSGEPAPVPVEETPAPVEETPVFGDPANRLGSKCTSGASACIGLQAGDSCGGGKKCKNAPICTCA